jgi:hypothetical protein
MLDALNCDLDRPRACDHSPPFAANKWLDQALMVIARVYVQDLNHYIVVGDCNTAGKLRVFGEP